MNNNGLLSSSETHPGLPTTTAYYLTENNGDVVVAGDLTINGGLTMANADASNNTNVIMYGSYPLAPCAIKVISPVPTITKQTSATIVSGSAFTIPITGYYAVTAQISLTTIGSSTPASDTITIYNDVSGGALTPINGAINTFNVVPNAVSAFYATSSGIIQQKLNAGDILNFYHLESGGYTFGAGSIGISYAYLGNNAI